MGGEGLASVRSRVGMEMSESRARFIARMMQFQRRIFLLCVLTVQSTGSQHAQRSVFDLFFLK